MDLRQQKPRLAEDILVWPAHQRGELVYRIEIPSEHRFFHVGYREYILMSLMDGRTGLPQACSQATARLGVDAPTSDETLAIVRWLLRNRIAYLEQDGPPIRNQPARDQASSQAVTERLGALNPFWMKCPVPALDRLINPIAAMFGFLASWPAVLLSLLLILSGSIVGVWQWDAIVHPTRELIHPQYAAFLLVVWIALKLVHELAHAIVCRRLGGEVREAGVRLVLFAPLAYVDVSSCWRMPSRWSRIAVGAAGMWSELCIASLATWLHWLIEDPTAESLCHAVILAASVSTIVFNANVLMRFDGYFMLADWIDVPNLATEANLALKNLARRYLAGETVRQQRLMGWRYPLVIAYGFAAMIWRVTVCVTLAITASTLWSGAGLLIALLGVVLWVGQPVSALLRYLRTLHQLDTFRFWRFCSCAGLLSASVILGIFVVPVPTSVQIPVVTRLAPHCHVRAPASGFVQSIEVTDGQRVNAGDVLLRLGNVELSHEVQDLENQLAQNELKRRQAQREHDEGSTQVILHQANAIASRLEQAKTRESSLTIRAAHSGQVIASGLIQQLGTFVSEGDVLMLIGRDADREWKTLIDQQQIRTVKENLGQVVTVRTANGRRYHSELLHIDPRATNRLTEPTLAANVGGPLAVQKEETQQEESLRLTKPHFCGVLKVPIDAAEVPIGTRLWADCGYQTLSIAERLSIYVEKIWDRIHHDSTLSKS